MDEACNTHATVPPAPSSEEAHGAPPQATLP